MFRQRAPAVAGALVRLFVAILVGSGPESRVVDSCRHQLVFDVYDGYACDVIVTSSPSGDVEAAAVTMIGAGAEVPRDASALRLTVRRALAAQNGSRTSLPHLPRLRRLEVDVSETSSFPAGLLSTLGAATVQELSVFRSASTDASDYRLRLPTSAELATFTTFNSSLSSLVLSDLGIEEVPLKTFDGLTTLRYLDVNKNRLSSLPDGLFDDLCRLSSLSLAQNRFVDVEGMSLTGNGQTRFLQRCGNGLARLRILNLYGNQLRRLRGGVFRRLRSVVELNLSGNELSVIDAGAFSGLEQLRTLYIDENQLVNLVPAMFDGLTTLTTLDVGDNRLSGVASGVFRYLTELRTLYLQENEIESVSSGAWTGLDKLTELNLAANRINVVDKSTFVGLCSLRQMDLSENQLSAAPANAFVCLTALERLRLSDNLLSDAVRRRTEERQWWLNDTGTGPVECEKCGRNASMTTTSADNNIIAGRHDVRPGLTVDYTPSSSSAAVRKNAPIALAVALVIGVMVVVALFLTLATATHLLRPCRAVFDCRRQRSYSTRCSSYGHHSDTACTLDSSIEGLYVKYRT